MLRKGANVFLFDNSSGATQPRIKSAMRTFLPNVREWITAILFPFKLYTVIAGVWLLIWQATLPPNRMQSWKEPLFNIDFTWAIAAGEFTYVAHNVVVGYFASAAILLIGGLIQRAQCQRRAAVVSVAFGIAALIIGLLLRPYGHARERSIMAACHPMRDMCSVLSERLSD